MCVGLALHARACSPRCDNLCCVCLSDVTCAAVRGAMCDRRVRANVPMCGSWRSEMERRVPCGDASVLWWRRLLESLRCCARSSCESERGPEIRDPDRVSVCETIGSARAAVASATAHCDWSLEYTVIHCVLRCQSFQGTRSMRGLFWARSCVSAHRTTGRAEGDTQRKIRHKHPTSISKP